MENDIFDLGDQSDLPVEMRANLSNGPKYEKEIISLFELKETLRPDEIIVGLFRRYNMHITKSSLLVKMCTLHKQKKVIRLRKGVYILNKVFRAPE